MIDVDIMPARISDRSVSRAEQNPLADIADAELLAPLRAGTAWAFEVLVRRYTPRLLSVARRFLRSEEDQADAVQDAFLCAYRSLRSFAGKAQLSTWLYRVMVNVCLTKLRSQSRHSTVPLGDFLSAGDESRGRVEPAEPSPESGMSKLELAETRALVRACIDRLPAAYRRVLLLRDFNELDTDQTARLIGTTRAVVKTRLHRARRALGTLLEPLLGM
jgi:RNA polymerase sigma-70 factor (ECF subfamily)